MLTRQQAAIIDHLKRTNQNGYIQAESPEAKRLAPDMLHENECGLFRGTPDELSAYYEALNEARRGSIPTYYSDTLKRNVTIPEN